MYGVSVQTEFSWLMIESSDRPLWVYWGS